MSGEVDSFHLELLNIHQLSNRRNLEGICWRNLTINQWYVQSTCSTTATILSTLSHNTVQRPIHSDMQPA